MGVLYSIWQPIPWIPLQPSLLMDSWSKQHFYSPTCSGLRWPHGDSFFSYRAFNVDESFLPPLLSFLSFFEFGPKKGLLQGLSKENRWLMLKKPELLMSVNYFVVTFQIIFRIEKLLTDSISVILPTVKP